MLRYKALSIINSFSDIELKKFQLFLDSPYFNRQKKVALFYNILLKFENDFNDPKLTNEYLMKKLGTNSISTLKNLFADLFEECKLFLRQIYSEKNHYCNFEAILSECISRNLSSLFPSLYESTLTEFEASKAINLKDFLFKADLNNLYTQFADNNGPIKENHNVKYFIDLETETAELILAFQFLVALSTASSLISHNNSYNFELNTNSFFKHFKQLYPESYIDELCEYFKKKYKESRFEVLVDLYYLIYKCRTTTDKTAIEYFIKFKDCLKKNSNRLELDLKYDLYQHKNWLILYVLQHPEFEDIEFEFYEQFLKDKGYMATGKNLLSDFEFKNILTRSDNTFRYNWSDKFIKKYSKHIDKSKRNQILSIRKANYFLRKENRPDLALKELNKIAHLDNYAVKRDFHQFVIMCYFELSMFNELKSKCDSFRHFLVNQKIGSSFSDPFKKFIKYTLKLSQLKESGIKPEYDLYKQIEEDSVIASKLWLLNHAENLQN